MNNDKEHRQPAAKPVSKTAEELVRKLQGECMFTDEFFYDAELAKNLIQAALNVAEIRAGEKVRAEAIIACDNIEDGDGPCAAAIFNIDIATILKGDK